MISLVSEVKRQIAAFAKHSDRSIMVTEQVLKASSEHIEQTELRVDRRQPATLVNYKHL